jgi:hypothetical protein
MSPEHEPQSKSLPPPWDRIFSLGTRTFVWALLLGVLYLLQPFLLLIFLTFVFAYIQAHGVDGLQQRIPNRPLRVVIVGLVFLGTIVATVFALTPQIKKQASDLIDNHQNYINGADWELNGFLRNYPDAWSYLTHNGESEEDAAPDGQDGEPKKPPPAQDPGARKDPKDPARSVTSSTRCSAWAARSSPRPHSSASSTSAPRCSPT